MNKIKSFRNSEFGIIRTVKLNNQPYFVLKDVAVVLGYKNPIDDLSKCIDIKDKEVEKYNTFAGVQNLTVINESGLYHLILSSKLPTAWKFKDWVTNEVLPSIRKHSAHAEEERAKRQILELENGMQKKQIAELRPKAIYHDLILQSKSAVPITQIAKDYGMSGRKFNQLLHNMSIQYRMGSTWILYQKYAEYGYTQSRTYFINADKSVMHTYWTPKGQRFLYEILKHHGILPVLERKTMDY